MLTFETLDAVNIAELAADIHPDDAAELHAAGVENLTAMLMDAREGFVAQAARWEGRLFASFGLMPWPMDDTVGVPWMLCTRQLDSVPAIAIARSSRDVLADMLGKRPVLLNMAHAKHSRAAMFVAWLGFQIDETPVGPGGAFRMFRLEGGRHV